MVYAVMEAQLEAEDRLLHRLAYQFTGVMFSSGNLEKGLSPERVVSSIYAPILGEPEEQLQAVSEDVTVEDAAQRIREIENRILRGTVGS